MAHEWEQYVQRARARWGERLDLSDIEERFLPYFRGPRIKVTSWGDTRTGVVGVTTGYKPALLLIHRRSDRGSSDVLGPRDELVAVQRGRKYVEVATSQEGGE